MGKLKCYTIIFLVIFLALPTFADDTDTEKDQLEVDWFNRLNRDSLELWGKTYDEFARDIKVSIMLEICGKKGLSKAIKPSIDNIRDFAAKDKPLTYSADNRDFWVRILIVQSMWTSFEFGYKQSAENSYEINPEPFQKVAVDLANRILEERAKKQK